jgi:hypothetical protein
VSEFIAAAIGEGEFELAEIGVRDHPELVGKSLDELESVRAAEAIVISIHDEGGAIASSRRAIIDCVPATRSYSCVARGFSISSLRTGGRSPARLRRARRRP